MHIRAVRDYRAFALLSVILQGLAVVALRHCANICGTFFCFQMSAWYAVVACMILGRVLIWNMALSRGQLSNVYVFTALNPVFLLCFSFLLLGERTSRVSLLGAATIVVAIYYSQRRGRRESGLV